MMNKKLTDAKILYFPTLAKAKKFAAKIQGGELDGWKYDAVIVHGVTAAIRVYDEAGAFVDYWRDA